MVEEVTEVAAEEAKPPRKNEAKIEVEVIRSIGFEGHTGTDGTPGMARPGERVKIKRSDARALQDAGAIKILI